MSHVSFEPFSFINGKYICSLSYSLRCSFVLLGEIHPRRRSRLALTAIYRANTSFFPLLIKAALLSQGTMRVRSLATLVSTHFESGITNEIYHVSKDRFNVRQFFFISLLLQHCFKGSALNKQSLQCKKLLYNAEKNLENLKILNNCRIMNFR